MTSHPDQAALERVASDLDSTLVVVAGAGSGKTRTLVTRLCQLVLTAGVPLRNIAAITFTEKAANELRERVRQALAASDHPAAPAARAELDGAAVGTLHSFAQRLLTENAVEAGLPPKVEVLDEVSSSVMFGQRWNAFVDQLLEDGAVAEPLLVLTSAGVRIDALRDIAVAFNANWDLLEARPPAETPIIPRLGETVTDILERLEPLLDLRHHCIDESDPMAGALDDHARWAEDLDRASDQLDLLELLLPGEGRRPKRPSMRTGAKTRWTGGFDLNGLRSDLAAIHEHSDELVDSVTNTALSHLAERIRTFTLENAAERRRQGRLEFHDLLVMARQLLQDPEIGPDVRAAVRSRYQRLLIDELQDTDPIQMELATLIAADPAGTPQPRWQDTRLEGGRLFLVGDPKQSIYRFRRADLQVFLDTVACFGGDSPLHLSANHRSGAGVIDWANRVFGRLMTQPPYEPSQSLRQDPPQGSSVAVLGKALHEDKPRADEIRSREAADVAGAIRAVLQQGWEVDASNDWERPRWRPATASDIAVLVPDRRIVPYLEDALAEQGVPYRTEAASLIYASRLVRDVLITLRAIDDPSDELATVSALRSPLFGCGDDDLFTYISQPGSGFEYTRRPDEAADPEHPVVQGLDYLREMHQLRRWLAPSAILDRVLRDRRVLELAAAPGASVGRARDAWHRLRFLTDQARAWVDSAGGTLRDYLNWVEQQASPVSRVTEAVLPETDDEAVRIMTIHAAKGLEFPVAIVAGLSTQPRRPASGGQVAWPPDQPYALKAGRNVTSDAYRNWQPLDEQMSHEERIRLLYVACTRARDHLIVSLHRRGRATAPDHPRKLTSAELLAQALGEDLDTLPELAAEGDVQAAPSGRDIQPPAAAGLSPIPLDQWASERTVALRQSGQPRTVAATTLNHDGLPDRSEDPGLHKRPRDLDLPPWRKGRYGTAIGRAIHGVLQTIDLGSGDGLDAVVAAQAMAEGVAGSRQEEHLRSLVRAALDSRVVVEAAAGPHWREVHVAVPLVSPATTPDSLLEGYIDLLYRRPDGELVVVDYKTGPESVDNDVTPLIDQYRWQGASYAHAVEQATGSTVAAVVFLFLTPEGAIERTLPGLRDTIAQVITRVLSRRDSDPTLADREIGVPCTVNG